jgi:hypothetical protein
MRHFSTAHTCGRIRHLSCKANRSKTMEERMMNRLTVKQGVERSYKGMHALQIPLHFGLCLKMLLALAIAALAQTSPGHAYDGEYQLPASFQSPNRCTVDVWTSKDSGADTTATIDMLIWFQHGHTYRWRLDKRNANDQQRGAHDTYYFSSLYYDSEDGRRDENHDGWADAPYLDLHNIPDGRDDGWLWTRIRVTCFFDGQPLAAWQWDNLGFAFSDYQPIWVHSGWYHFYQGTPIKP